MVSIILEKGELYIVLRFFFCVFFFPSHFRVHSEPSAVASERVWVFGPWCYCGAVCDSQALAAEAVIHGLPEWCLSYPAAIAELPQTVQRAPDSNRTVSRLSHDNPVISNILHFHRSAVTAFLQLSQAPCLSAPFLPYCSLFSLLFFVPSLIQYVKLNLWIFLIRFFFHICASHNFRRQQMSIKSHTYNLPPVIFAAVNVRPLLFVCCMCRIILPLCAGRCLFEKPRLMEHWDKR